jgi:hypothetical protein
MFFDLARRGIAEQELNRYFNYQGKITSDVSRGHFAKGKNEYYPIPQRQIDLSSSGGSPVISRKGGQAPSFSYLTLISFNLKPALN